MPHRVAGRNDGQEFASCVAKVVLVLFGKILTQDSESMIGRLWQLFCPDPVRRSLFLVLIPMKFFTMSKVFARANEDALFHLSDHIRELVSLPAETIVGYVSIADSSGIKRSLNSRSELKSGAMGKSNW